MFQERLEGNSQVRVVVLLTQFVSELLDTVLFKLAIQLPLPPLRHANHVVRANFPGVLPVVLGALKDLLAHEVDSLRVLHHHVALIGFVRRLQHDHLLWQLLQLELTSLPGRLLAARLTGSVGLGVLLGLGGGLHLARSALILALAHVLSHRIVGSGVAVVHDSHQALLVEGLVVDRRRHLRLLTFLCRRDGLRDLQLHVLLQFLEELVRFLILFVQLFELGTLLLACILRNLSRLQSLVKVDPADSL